MDKNEFAEVGIMEKDDFSPCISIIVPMLLFSDDVVEFDCIVSKVMGLDYNKLSVLNHAVGFKPLTNISYEDIEVRSNDTQCAGKLKDISFASCSTPFVAGDGWRGRIELKIPEE